MLLSAVISPTMMVGGIMRKRTIIVYGVLLFLVVVGVATWFARANPRVFARYKRNFAVALGLAKESKDPQSAPEELSINFDPSVNEATFSIISSNQAEQTLTLKYMYPENKAGEQVESKIVCGQRDYRVGTGKSKPKNVTSEEFWKKAVGGDGEMMVLSGLCGNNECREIVSVCYLYLSGAKAL